MKASMLFRSLVLLRRSALITLSMIASVVTLPVLAANTYYTPEQIVSEVFGNASDDSLEKGALWMTPERRAEAKDLLGDAPRQARIRYQAYRGNYLWTLSETGKEKPITFAVQTSGGQIVRIEVMVFREVRGDEIRLPQYTAQYEGLSLNSDGALSDHIDGISGATYSVRSMKKVAKMALLLDRWANEDNAVTP